MVWPTKAIKKLRQVNLSTALEHLKLKLLAAYFAEHSRWVHWLPVGLIFGIGIYFTLPYEPSFLIYLFLLLFGISAIFWGYKNPNFGLFTYFISGFCFGFCIIGVRVYFNAIEMFNTTQQTTNISGRIESIENHPYKNDGTYRIILDQVKINNAVYAAKLRLNISEELAQELQIHDQLKIKASIYPIPMPSSLYGYFARRAAYLQGIGGTARLSKILNHERAAAKPFTQYRHTLTQNLLSHLKEPYGAIASALVTGDRSYIPHKLRQAFVDAGLAHVLAISGLHLSLIAGLVFLCLRRLMCLWTAFSLAFSPKKVAACLAVIASMCYMAVANFGIPVQRSFIMITLAMLAVCLDRTVFSMRSLALAATIVLICFPESLLSASFQLSFAAVLGLLAFYESAWHTLQEKVFQSSSNFLSLKKIAWGIFGIFMTTFIASCATTPFSVAFFQRFTAQAILGNLLAIPLVGFFVMPLGFFSVFSLTFGGSDILFWLWEKSLNLLCLIAQQIALLPGAAIQVKAVPTNALVIFSIGMLWLCLWKKPWRWFGTIPIFLSVILWRTFELPFAYISQQCDVMAYHQGNIVYVCDDAKRNTFSVDAWAQEWGINKRKKWQHKYHHFKALNLLLITSPKDGIEYLHEIIDEGALVDAVITFGYERTLKKHGFRIAKVIDRNIIQYEGGVAVYKNPLRFCFLKPYFGSRPWCISFDEKK
jgi:competence protein ComEC